LPSASSPDFYVGIDIGTTNTKAVSLRRDVHIGAILRAQTPIVERKGALFFDLLSLEKIVRGYLEYFRARGIVRGVSFTSVGESIVPVRGGSPLCDPLVWYDPATSEIESRIWPEIESVAPRKTTGITSSSILALYKILWTREAMGIREPESWLPLSSFLVYWLAGSAAWDFSHASRTMMLDIATCAWNSRILSQFGLESSLGPLRALGTPVGFDRERTPYFLGGHDHITGLFGVDRIVRGTPFILDSNGSSESVVTLGGSLSPLLAEQNCAIGVAFHSAQYYLLKGLRSFGTFLESIAVLSGAHDVRLFYEAVNERLLREKALTGRTIDIIVGGDPVAGDGCSTFSLMNIPIGTDPAVLVHSAYVYLGAMSRILTEEVTRHAGENAEIVTSGAVTSNRLLMQYKAAILGRPLGILRTEELGAVGAALCAAAGSEDSETIDAFVSLQEKTTVAPDGSSSTAVREESQRFIERYRRILQENVKDAVQTRRGPLA
jgi:L-fuculokinase